jgi:hypothetical protein
MWLVYSDILYRCTSRRTASTAYQLFKSAKIETQKLKIFRSSITQMAYAFSFIRLYIITTIICIVISQSSFAKNDTEAVVDSFFSRGGHTNNWAVLVEYQSTFTLVNSDLKIYRSYTLINEPIVYICVFIYL